MGFTQAIENKSIQKGLTNIDRFASGQTEAFNADFRSIPSGDRELVDQSLGTLIVSLIFKC